MKKSMRLCALLLSLLLLLSACGEKAPAAPSENTGAFQPKLDTEKSVELNVAGFFGNFEALDQVINHFNVYYPNVTISYDRLGDTQDAQFLLDNPSIDIFMTTTEKGYPTEYCVDLLAAGVDVSAVADGVLESNTVGGKLLALPMGLKMWGLAVNKTLLTKEGLSVPQTWQEFLDVLEALKQKGYTPIQGPNSWMGSLGRDMGMAMLQSDPALLEAVRAGDAAGAAGLETVYERVFELSSRGYLSREVNEAYPDDNYDGAILEFFEGDVPFWVCDTEKVSGMKKRESKSEHYSADPFDYEFISLPIGDSGVCSYVEPWYGFSVNKDSKSVDYAVEFLRFMAREEELNTLASVKGVPSIARNASDERYVNLGKTEKIEYSVISNGTVPDYFGTLMCNVANDQLASGTPDAKAAVEIFVNRCHESLG